MHWFILSYVCVFYPTLGYFIPSIHYPRIIHTKYKLSLLCTMHVIMRSTVRIKRHSRYAGLYLTDWLSIASQDF